MTHVQTQTTQTLRESLRLYAWLFLIPIRRELRYRSELLLSILSTLIGIFIQVTVWTALYTGREQVAGIGLADMLSYVFLASVIGTFTSSSAAGALERMMSSGDIARELLRPMNLAVRIFVMDAYSTQIDQPFQRMATTRYNSCRPRVPIDADHVFQPMSTTRPERSDVALPIAG